MTTTSDASGNFDLGVIGGTWFINLGEDTAASLNVVGVGLTLTLADGDTTSGINLDVVDGTGTISGNVKDTVNANLSFAQVFAYATISSVFYSANGQTDNNGNYSFPVIDGVWTVGVLQPGFTNQIANVGAPTHSATVNFVQSVFNQQPQNQNVTAGQGASFNIGTNTPGSNTVQWQRLPAGSGTWGDLTNDATYSGVTTNGLGVANTTVIMNGDQFRCVVTYNAGASNATSNTATLLVISQFQAWQNAHFTPAQLADPNISGPLATPVGDGVSNLMKYALNLQPFTNCTTLVPRPTRVGSTLTMTFQASHSDVTYTVQVSNDLQSWTTSGVVIQTVGQQVTATFDTTGHPQSFMRLMVAMP